MTVTLTRKPSLADLIAVKGVSEKGCRCPDAAKVMKGESDKLLCKPCRVRKRWNELVRAVDES